MLQTFRVDYHNENGDDLGAYISAETPLQAAKLWFPFYLEMSGDAPDSIDPDRQCEVQAIPSRARIARLHGWQEVPHCGFFTLRNLNVKNST